jgi:mannose-6-phosphate isomerase
MDEKKSRGLGQNLLAVEPQYRERVWGGTKLRSAEPRIGEAWIAFGESVVAGGPRAGRTIADLTVDYPDEILGADVRRRYGARFPLLIKFLDSEEWLSVQVHPNNEQAARMVGPDEFGKTEAWYFLETKPAASILAGVKAGTDEAELAAAIRESRVLDLARGVAVAARTAILIPAGTLHAVGPGLFLYEIQQASDTTYRAYDWGRPQSNGRKLHIEEAVAVTLPVGPSKLIAARSEAEGPGRWPELSCPYFQLDAAQVGPTPLAGDTDGRSFHIVTAIEGAVELTCGDERLDIATFGTAIVAGAAGKYGVRAAKDSARVLVASVPAE